MRKFKKFFSLFKELYNNRKLIMSLAKNDFKNKFAGSYLGIIWGFIQPTITILVYWFVFQVGFKSQSVDSKVPFVLWLMCGMIPWFFFSDVLLSATNCMLEYNYLVKKVVFKVSTLPVVKLISSLFIHLFFVSVIFLMFFLYGDKISLYNLEAFYYTFCMIILLLGLTFATSAIIVFFRDMGQIINVFLQFGFWLTPIFWSYKNLPTTYIKYFKLNPMYYIVEGYRDSFINHVWFWERYNQTAYFWVVSLLFFISGAVIFKKLKPHFSDVL